MFSKKVDFGIVCFSVYITGVLCQVEENLHKSSSNADLNSPKDITYEVSSMVQDPINFLFPNVENQMDDYFRQIQKPTIDNENKKTFDDPLFTIFNRIPIISTGDNNESPHISTTQKKTNNTSMSSELDQIGSPNLNDILKMFAIDGTPAVKEEPLGVNSNVNFESLFDFDGILKQFGSLFSPLQFLIPSNLHMDKPGDDPLDNIGDIYVVEIGNDYDGNENPTVVNVSVGKPTQGSALVSENRQSASLQNMISELTDSMKDMMQSLRESFNNFSAENSSEQKKYFFPEAAPKLNISVSSQGDTVYIPSDAFVVQNSYGLVNITWKSRFENINNSLCFTVTEDDGYIVFQHMHLRILEGGKMNGYSLNHPVYINPMNIKSNNTINIQLTESLGIRFVSAGFLDVITMPKSENFSTQWLVFFIAVLGLIIAGLIMLLSYIIYKKSQSYPRKESISKEAIVY